MLGSVIGFLTCLGMSPGFDYVDLMIWSAFGMVVLIPVCVVRSASYLVSHG